MREWELSNDYKALKQMITEYGSSIDKLVCLGIGAMKNPRHESSGSPWGNSQTEKVFRIQTMFMISVSTLLRQQNSGLTIITYDPVYRAEEIRFI